MKSWNLQKNGEVSSVYLNLFIGSFCDIAQSYDLFTSQYLIYDSSLFLS